MRLSEIIDFKPRMSNIDRKEYSNRVNKGATPTNVDLGHFARVTQHKAPKRVDQVNKIGTAGKVGYDLPIPRTEIDEDGYLSYLRMTLTDKTDNPFFPVIHDLKIRKHPKTGVLTYNVKMEKLAPFDDIFKDEELLGVVKNKLFGRYIISGDDPLYIEFWNMVIQATDGGKHRVAKDPELLYAIQKIDDVAHRYEHHWDMGMQNMMWRRSGDIPQLVFTDPLS